jgi:hypothetical protein
MKRLFSAILVLPVAAAALGVHVDGGLIAYRRLETRTECGPVALKRFRALDDSYWAGAGLAVPVWRHEGFVTPSLELATEAGFNRTCETFEYYYYGTYELTWYLISLRENAVFGVALGRFKPFVGLGVGAAVVPWQLRYVELASELERDVEVAPTVSIPFGCEWRPADKVGVELGVEYLTITGAINAAQALRVSKVMMPDPFLFYAKCRYDI